MAKLPSSGEGVKWASRPGSGGRRSPAGRALIGSERREARLCLFDPWPGRLGLDREGRCGCLPAAFAPLPGVLWGPEPERRLVSSSTNCPLFQLLSPEVEGSTLTPTPKRARGGGVCASSLLLRFPKGLVSCRSSGRSRPPVSWRFAWTWP